jgi:predicted secreted protein
MFRRGLVGTFFEESHTPMKSHVYLLLALFCWCGCADEGVNVSPWDRTALLDASIQGKTMTTAVDSRFRLELEVWADAGYQWDCHSSDSTVLQLERTSIRGTSTSTPPAPGGSSLETFYFHATSEGRSAVTLIHHRSWLPTEPAADSVGFLVEVRP